MLKVQGMTKRFGGITAVDNLNFQIEEGGIFGLIGPNGAGKTTVFNLICGFERPDGGRVFFKGEDITHLKPYQICWKGIARTFQIVKLFENLSVLENVLVGATFGGRKSRRDPKEKALEIIQLLELTNVAQRLCKNLTLALKKRVEMARALATDPKLLLLDEVLAGLNPSEVDESLPLLSKIREEQGITILMIEHVMRAVMNASDYIIVLNQGRKIAEGIPSQIANDAKVIQAYLGEEYVEDRGY